MREKRTRFQRLIALCLMISFATSCAPAGSECAWSKQLQFSDRTIDVMTRDELLQVNNHNDAVKRFCR